MLDSTTFSYIFLVAVFTGVVLLRKLNKHAPPLRRAWNVYGTVYVLHFILFACLVYMLPATQPLSSLDTDEIPANATVESLSTVIRQQREHIRRFETSLHSTTQAVHTLALVLLLFGPMLYYNLFKYNLEIERISGKRMGSME